jgi:hypothetical protein
LFLIAVSSAFLIAPKFGRARSRASAPHETSAIQMRDDALSDDQRHDGRPPVSRQAFGERYQPIVLTGIPKEIAEVPAQQARSGQSAQSRPDEDARLVRLSVAAQRRSHCETAVSEVLGGRGDVGEGIRSLE